MKIVQSVPSVCHNKTKSRQISVCQLKNVSRETTLKSFTENPEISIIFKLIAVDH